VDKVDFSDPDDPFGRVAESVFRSFIEDGSIIIGDEPPDEIILIYKALLVEMLAANVELHRIADHRLLLLERAKDESASGTPEIAITFYALWIEHVANGNLVAGLQRKGYDLDVINPLIRELKLRTKLTALWSMAGFDPLSDADLALVDQISQARNAFVHYKWGGHNESVDQSIREQLRRVLDRAQNLEAVFNSRERSLLWNGREDEIINFYREDVRRHVQEAGPFTFGDGDDSAESSSPS
jgi:hypothetical protein